MKSKMSPTRDNEENIVTTGDDGTDGGGAAPPAKNNYVEHSSLNGKTNSPGWCTRW